MYWVYNYVKLSLQQHTFNKIKIYRHIFKRCCRQKSLETNYAIFQNLTYILI